MPVLGNIKIGLVERQRLDQVGIVEEDCPDLLADGAIDIEPGLDEDQVGATPFRGDRRHRRAHAERPRFVARRRDHAAMPAAYRDRFALEAWIIALLHGRIKSIHVDVDDLASGAVVSPAGRDCRSAVIERTLHHRRVLIKARDHEHPRISGQGIARQIWRSGPCRPCRDERRGSGRGSEAIARAIVGREGANSRRWPRQGQVHGAWPDAKGGVRLARSIDEVRDHAAEMLGRHW